MSKIVKETHILAEEGVNAFATYCNKHRPYIIWREEVKNDFGIDGEIELTRTTQDGKLEATGKITKIQLKSTTGGYIFSESEKDFKFTPREEDIKYWHNHELNVILVVYLNGRLYARKIEKSDFVNKKKTTQPITFNKIKNILEEDESTFLEKFQYNFVDRISYDVVEQLCSNIFKVNLPNFIYSYPAKISKSADLKDKISFKEQPEFIINSKKIFTFQKLEKLYPQFKDLAVETGGLVKEEVVRNFIKEKNNQKLLIELMNNCFKTCTSGVGIGFNKDYSRYYFKLFDNEVERKIPYISKTGRNQKEGRSVAKYYEYGKTAFFRHLAFETNFLIIENDLFMSIIPKYLFTSDRKTVLDNPKKITKLTNAMTKKEFNQQMLNHIHFIFYVLSKNKDKIELINNEKQELSISSYIKFSVKFGIPNDNQKKSIREQNNDQKLF